jgi:1-acyl-sn-glycerol-3-phosphate acyltransferase
LDALPTVPFPAEHLFAPGRVGQPLVMPDTSFTRRLARAVPRPLDGFAEIAANVAHEWRQAIGGEVGDDLDAWDPEYIRRTLPILGRLFRNYFRGEVNGLERIPDGPALLVGNHSGGTMIADTFVFATCFYERFGPERRFHQLAHDIAARLPGLGIRPWGTVRASHDNARRAFELGAPVLVYPGGDWETFRPSWQTDQIDFADRKGFIHLACEENVPIVPVVSIGGQETALFLTRGERAAKLTGLDRTARIKVLPVSLGPPFGISVLDMPPRLPLPAKIEIEVLEPIGLRERFGAHPDPDEVYDEVTGEMQEALDALSADRTAPVVG